MSSALTSQRFCLRWNNHQSNLLTVFDQLLHDESFVDVTLAVEGRFLRAHKMVLSACSPYFQALFVGHPDKHPIVILKDVPYCDMRSLLDFMYRGEVSVDQERLTAFLKVAESLRIKGLTEVNEDRCDLPTITSSLLSTAVHSPSPPVPPPPPHLHRIHPTGHKRAAPPPATAANPLLGSALTAPKRKRGRPRKLSGSSPGPGAPPNLLPAAPAPAAAALSGGGLVDSGHQARGQPTSLLDGNDLDASRLGGESIVVQGSPEMLEVKMGTLDFQQNSPPPAPTASSTPSASGGGGSSRADTENGQASPELSRGSSGKDLGTRRIKEEPEPAPGPSSQDPGQAFIRSGTDQDQQAFALACTPGNMSASGAACADGDDGSSLPEDENELITLSPTSDADLDEEEGRTMVQGEEISQLDTSKITSRGENVGLSENGDANLEMHADRVLEGYDLRVKTEQKDEKTDNTTMNEDGGNGAEAKDGTDNVDDGDGGDVGDDHDDGEENASQMSSTRSFCMREADNLFRCKVCQKTYTHISNFCRHYLTTHKQRRQVFGCPACGKEFTRRDNMMTHLKGVHRHILMPF